MLNVGNNWLKSMQPKMAKTEHLKPIEHNEIFKTRQRTADLKHKD